MDRLSNRRRFLKRGALFVPVAFGILRAQNIMPGPIMRPMAAGGGPLGDLLSENCEDASVGWDSNNANGWVTGGGGTVDPKYTPALAGTQSVSAPSDSYGYAPFTATAEIWVYCLFKCVSMTAGDYSIITLRSAAGSWPPLFNLHLRGDSSGRLKIIDVDLNEATTVDGLTTDTTYNLWLHYASGAGGALDTEFQPTGTGRSGSGNKFASRTHADASSDPGRFYIQHDGITEVHVYDTIRVSSTGYPVP